MTFDPVLLEFAVEHQVAIERELGARSLYHFFRMAWPLIDPAPFLDNWHIRLLCEELQAAAERKVLNLVINLPPRHGKSALTSVAFPAWIWTWWPSAKFICASYDQRMAFRDAGACRRLVMGPWYQARWPHVRVRDDHGAISYYQTVAGGHRFTTTPNSGVTGEGADVIIGDDLHNVKQAESEAERASTAIFWFEAIPSRLNNPNQGVKIVIQQRVHELDVAGECLRRGYYPVVLPARYNSEHRYKHPKDPRKEGELLWPKRINEQTLSQLEREMGSYASAGQYGQWPVPRAGGLFKRHWFQVHDAAPAEAEASAVRRWDLAASVAVVGTDPDWTVGLLLGRDDLGRFWVLDVKRFRAGPRDVEMAIRLQAQLDGLGVPIGIPEDPGQAGRAQSTYLVAQMAPYTVTAFRETGDKVTRALPVAAQAEAGNLRLLKGDWNAAFIDELCSFPTGRHDDQVDALSGAFVMLTQEGAGLLEFMRMNRGDYVEEPPSTERIERIILR